MSTSTPISWERSVGATVLTTVAGTVPFFLTATLALRIGDSLGFDEAGLGALLASFAVGGALAAPLTGRAAERIGAELALRLSCVGSGVLLVAIGATTTHWSHLAVFLALAGIVSTLNQAAGNLWLIRTVGDHQRIGLAFGLKQAGAPASALLAGLAVPTIAMAIGWRLTFVTAGFGALLVTWVVPRVGLRGSSRTAAGREGDVAMRPLLMVALGMGVGTAAGTAFTGFAVTAMVEQANMAESSAGLLYAVGAVVGIGARVGIGGLVDTRRGSLFRASALLVALGGLGFLALATGYEMAYMVGVPFAFATAWSWTGVFNQAVTLANAGSPAAATGITQVGALSGVIVGPLIFGLAAGWSYTAAWMIMAAVSMVGSATILLGRRLIRSDAARRGDAGQRPAPR